MTTPRHCTRAAGAALVAAVVLSLPVAAQHEPVDLDAISGTLTFNGLAIGGKPVDRKVVSLH